MWTYVYVTVFFPRRSISQSRASVFGIENTSSLLRMSHRTCTLCITSTFPSIFLRCIRTFHPNIVHHRATAAGVLLLNEIGLDPGIDHLTALDLISRVSSDGQVIQSFTSFCGGLPAPDVEHTPLRYKFSWSPQGVLSAALNGASFKLDGNVSSTHPLTSLCVSTSNHLYSFVPLKRRSSCCLHSRNYPLPASNLKA